VQRLEDEIRNIQRNLKIVRKIRLRSIEAIGLVDLGDVLHEARRFEEAIDAYQRAIDILRKRTRSRRDEAAAQCGLGLSLRAAKRLPEGVGAYQRAVDIFRAA
jgi:tetratricopeptide (TPR) repeat protein